MSRTIRWTVYGRRQREVLGLAIGFSAVFGAGLYQLKVRRPLLADGGTYSETKTWGTKRTIVSHNESLAERSKKSSEQRKQTPIDASSPGTGATQPPPPQTKRQSTSDSTGDHLNKSTSASQDVTDKYTTIWDSITVLDFRALRSKITDAMPSWIKYVPGYIDKLQDELSMAPWSLGWEMWEDAHDPEINPEIVWDAHVRLSKALCPDEQAFRRDRLKHTTKALAQYLGVPESEVHPDDVPIIGVCGSGGGLRALVAGASSSLCAQESGLFDCVTYTAGVSGSCWLQTLYNSSIGERNYQRVIDHLKQRLGVHIAYPPTALALLSSAPTNKFLLSGILEKLRGVPDADFGMVDIYGLLLAARLLVPKDELRVSDSDLKISNQRFSSHNGGAPLPIYTAVRHEVPDHIEKHQTPSQYAWPNTEQFDWFQWFEWTPYEFFCEELECGIPTWAVGRRWDAGQTAWRENGLALPELRVPLMMGVWGSAFCATLSHYYKEVRPILKAAGLDKFNTLLSGKDDDLVKTHPIDPAVIPNFALGLRSRLPETVPESIHEAKHLQLMDAGMSNNLPIYPLLRPGRDVDVILAFDASADVKTDNWVKVVDGYARQRSIRAWPMGAGWPSKSDDMEKTVQQLGDAQASSTGPMSGVLEGAQYLQEEPEDLGYCNIWVGTMREEFEEQINESPSRRVKSEDDERRHLTSPDAGITLIYFPFLKNDKVPGVDPMKSDFMSTWNFIYTPEEIDKVVNLARANFDEGKEQTRRTIRAVWERKKASRLRNEEDAKKMRKKYRLRQFRPDTET
ncbi:hypothetical protein LTR37_002893 [Vermiconidia calcicola]|uniref:Uncharacterized protein n=1 Tax=Vermiconidia calcicola TaxID=1690605 RepID=A0ACC3NR73_9PEZI|nr:hypothetical protein LTR37_002893 [Vermiconidia calcicola]